MSKIESALTPDEWGVQLPHLQGPTPTIAWKDDYSDLSLRLFPRTGLALIDRTHGSDYTLPAELLPAVMALANAALPDDDPRKITRAKLDLIQRVMRSNESLPMEIYEAGLAALQDMYALLPPEVESDVGQLVRDEFRAKHPPLFPEEG